MYFLDFWQGSEWHWVFGGGTILILLLNLFTNIAQLKVQGINLIFFACSSIVAIYMNLKNKNINFKIAKIMVVFGIIGSAIRCICIK